MELLVFGHSGSRVIFFPPRKSRFYDYENWRVIETLRPRIESGLTQIYCVDSLDCESLYNFDIHPKDRIKRHLQYENYILNEVIPLTESLNKNPYLVAAGCSLGAYHAVNISLKHPRFFSKTVGLSGRYDLTKKLSHYDDLFSGYHDETIYFNSPTQYVYHLHDEQILRQIRKIDFIFAVGSDDPCLPCNNYLTQLLSEKGINNHLHIWPDEAHQAYYWRKMAPIYI